MPLEFYCSNRLERLADLLADSMAVERIAPLEQRAVVVQTAGMGRWLSLRLADRNRICAGVEFLYPNALIERVASAILAESKEPLLAPALMTWRIMALLPLLCSAPESAALFAPVNAYLADDPNGMKLYQLSEKIADLFDQYQIYRPDMVLAWEDGARAHSKKLERDDAYAWQRRLWRELALPVSRARRHHELLDLFRHTGEGDPAAKLPARIVLFGVSVLPAFHLELLEAIARHVSVDCYQLQPCREYWGDIVDRREIRRMERSTGRGASELMLVEENPLLASFGAVGRDFFNMVLDLDQEVAQRHDLFDDVEQKHLLAVLQADLLDLKNPETESVVDLHPDDRSLAFHSCHSPLREVEVLHDQLLAIMEEDRLAPSEILVMCPDLAAYAPFIRAVFDRDGGESISLAYSIADLPPHGRRVLHDAFDHLLGLLHGRFPASAVLALLDFEAVAARFGFSYDDRRLLRHWVEESGIRWGVDAEMLAVDKLSPYDSMTWRAGLDRLLLGYAMAAEQGREVDHCFPVVDLPEDATGLLGRFLDYFEDLLSFRRKVERMRLGARLADWQRFLCELLDAFFSTELPYEEDVAVLRRGFLDIGEEEQLVGESPLLSLEVVRSVLQNRAAAGQHARGFLGGGITFCSMLPMRSIPFQVICLLGMNDGAFPRGERPLEYDLRLLDRRPGDRSARDNDKYLFLETLLSARSRLLITFTGQRECDNAIMPPATPVGELLDYIAQRRGLPAREREALLVRHRLQPFHRDYYRNHLDLFSYSRENCRAAQAAGGIPRRETFFSATLPEPVTREEEVALDDLLRFFSHPVQYLYNRVLSIWLDDRQAADHDHELFALDPLQHYAARQRLWAREETVSPRQQSRWMREHSLLPLGAPGQVWEERLTAEVEACRAWRDAFDAKSIAARDIGLALASGAVLRARLDHLTESCQLLVRPVRLAASRSGKGITVQGKKELIRAWLRHLVLCASGDLPDLTVCAGIELSAVRLQAVARPHALEMLDQLVGCFQQGRRQPLLFFPSYSLSLREGVTAEKLAARWQTDQFDGAADPYLRHCFPDNPLMSMEFVRLSETIAAPLYDAMELF